MPDFICSSGFKKTRIIEKGPNPPNCIILDKWVFENFILVFEPFAKSLWIFEIFMLVNNNLCIKLSLLSSITPNEILKVTWLPYFIPDFNLLSRELYNFTFKVLYWAILNYIKAKLFSNDRTKGLFTHWKLELIKSSKYWFCPSIDTFEWYLFHLIALLKLEFNCSSSFSLPSADKVTTETKSFVSVISIVSAAVEFEMTQVDDNVKVKLFHN